MVVERKRKWVVTSAWPYVNATPHLGTMIGSVLSADVFARYVRLKGDEVVFVSGSDVHGTPVAVEAKKQGISPEELAMKNHEKTAQLFKRWKISFDNYTQTHNPTHIKFCQDFYLDVQRNGYVSEKEIESLYCEKDAMYLPDRFVEGQCPFCGAENARGDQCDKCQRLLTPLELIHPTCAICGNPPIIKKTKHWYLLFPKLQNRLKTFIEQNECIPKNAKEKCLNSIAEGLPERAITRDLEWGIPAKFKGAEGKTIYVWFEAVLGYISAVKEWAEKIMKKPEKFEYFWKDPATRTVYFIGKDNIIFHLIVFPGLIMAFNENKKDKDKLVLPYNVSSTEFLMYENDKFSKSRGVGIWIDEALELAPLDYWRFNLIYNRPEKSDTSFLWSEFENNIKLLNDVIGNFIHRTLTFINKQFKGKVPNIIELDDKDKQFLEQINSIGKIISDLMERFELRSALREIVSFARIGNVYLNEKAPWHLIKENKALAGQVFNICVQAVHALAILLSPFIPDTSQKILEFLNFETSLKNITWESISDKALKGGHPIKKAKPLFEKLDIEEMKKKLIEIKKGEEEMEGKRDLISYEDFKKLDIRVAKILEVETVLKTKSLLKLTIDIGTEKRTIVAGLAQHYTPKELKNKQIVVLANLEPKKLRGIESQGMLLAAIDGDKVSILTPDKEIKVGAKIE
ncbi:MAG: methionine--tRNA ligase [Promethearchaeota archaeon]